MGSGPDAGVASPGVPSVVGGSLGSGKKQANRAERLSVKSSVSGKWDFRAYFEFDVSELTL